MDWQVKQEIFEFSEYFFRRVPNSVHKCILYVPW